MYETDDKTDLSINFFIKNLLSAFIDINFDTAVNSCLEILSVSHYFLSSFKSVKHQKVN